LRRSPRIYKEADVSTLAKAGVFFSGKRFHVVLVANIREHRAIRWQQVGDTAAALRLGEVGS